MTAGRDAAAQAAVQAARQAADRLGLGVTVAVCDAGGHLLALHRHAHALLASLESAQSKARTSVFFGVESRHLPSDAAVTPALLAAVPYPLAFLAGGLPLRDADGVLVGAVGVGGGAPAQDQAIAEAALAGWRATLAARPGPGERQAAPPREAGDAP